MRAGSKRRCSTPGSTRWGVAVDPTGRAAYVTSPGMAVVFVLGDRQTLTLSKSGTGIGTVTLDSEEAIEAYAEHLATHGVRASAFMLGNDFNREDSDAEVEWVIKVVNAAAALAVPAVRIDAIMTGEREMPLDARVAHFADCMKRVLDKTDYHIVEMGIDSL